MLKLTSPSRTLPPKACALHGSLRLMGAGHLDVEAATAHLPLSVKGVPCSRLAFWLCPCLWSQTQSFQTDVPRASET